MSRAEVYSLQQVAFDQLASAGTVTAAPLVLPKPVNPERCGPRLQSAGEHPLIPLAP